MFTALCCIKQKISKDLKIIIKNELYKDRTRHTVQGFAQCANMKL